MLYKQPCDEIDFTIQFFSGEDRGSGRLGTCPVQHSSPEWECEPRCVPRRPWLPSVKPPASCLLTHSRLQGHCLWPSCLSQRSLTVLFVFIFLKLSHVCLPLYLALGPITLTPSCVFQLWRHAVLHPDGLCGADGPRNSVLGYVFGGIH